MNKDHLVAVKPWLKVILKKSHTVEVKQEKYRNIKLN